MKKILLLLTKKNLENKNPLFILLLFTFFSCSTTEPEIATKKSTLTEDILGKWDIQHEGGVDKFSGTLKVYSKQSEADTDFRLFSLVFSQNSEYQVVHSRGIESGNYIINGEGSISLSKLGIIENIEILKGKINFILIPNKGLDVFLSGEYDEAYKQGGCISLIDCIAGDYWMRRFHPIPTDFNVLYYSYILFNSDGSNWWWEKNIFNPDGCMVSSEENSPDDPNISILAHSSEILIFRTDNEEGSFLFKYSLDKTSPWKYLDVKVVNLNSSEVSEFSYNLREFDDIPVFEDYPTCDEEQEEKKTFVPDNVFENALIQLGLDNELDNFVLTNKISDLKTLKVQGDKLKFIIDMTGIEDFTALESLTIENYGENIPDLGWTLNISKNVNLKSLFLSNFGVENIDFSTNTKLENVFISQTSLKTLNLSNNFLLNFLMIDANEFKLDLDFTDNVNLERLYFEVTSLGTLKLSNNNSLKEIQFIEVEVDEYLFSGIFENLITISLANYVREPYNKEISFSYFPNLTNLYAYNFHNKFDLSGNAKLKKLHFGNTTLGSIDVSKNSNLEELKILDAENLNCVQVNEVQMSRINNLQMTIWETDGAENSLDCT